MDGGKVKAVSRQELMGLLVTDADAFTAVRYLRHREAVPALPELEEKGKESLPGSEGALTDLYHALWDPEPSLKDEVAPDRKYWQQLLASTLATSTYQELHGQTQLKELQAVLGTVAMGEHVLAAIPEKDREQLKELQQAQSQANEAQQMADSAQTDAAAAGQLAQAAQAAASGQQSQSQGGQPSGSPTSGQGQLTPDQAQVRANQLAADAAKAKADAATANEMAYEAIAHVEQLAEELLGTPGSERAQEKMRELARIGMGALKAAQEKVEEVSSTIQSWGLEDGELFREGIPEALALLERMKRSAALKKFAALLGRIRKIAARKARSKIQGEGARVSAPETGRDIKRALSSELVALTNPALRVQALTRWSRGELRLRGEKAKAKLGHGPVVVCEDDSGSMDGDKQQWAKATVLSLAHYARLQRRSFGWVLFDGGVRQAKTYLGGQIGPKEMLELVESRAGGGTNFEQPLRKAMEMVQKGGLQKADICFITDGECAVSDAFLREFSAFKRQYEINVFAVLCDVGQASDATVRKFADRVERVSAFTAEEAEQKIFGHL